MNRETMAGEPSWKKRRQLIYMILVYCAVCIVYIMVWGEDSRKNETILDGCFFLAGAVVGYYVGGSTWQQVESIRQNKTPTKKYKKNNDILIPTAEEDETE